MDVSVHQGLARALQMMALPTDPQFDDLLARLDAVAAPHRAVAALETPALSRQPARLQHGLCPRWLPDLRAVA